MHNISFNDGMEEIMINNDSARVIRWNPTDSHFSKRYFEFIDYIEDLYARVQGVSKEIEGIQAEAGTVKISETDNTEAIRSAAATLASLSAELSEMLDKTFNAPISEIAFRGANPLSPTKDGHFLFDNFLTAIAPVVSASVEEANKAAQKRIAKYTAPVKQMAKGKRINAAQ